MARGEDDALSWSGDDDPTLDVVSRDPADSLPAGYTAVGRGSRPHEDAADAPESEQETPSAGQKAPGGMGNAALVTLGVLGGVYLLWTIGWLLGGLRLADYAQFLVSPVGFQVSLWLAVAASPIWFLTVFLLTRRSKLWLRLSMLIVGVLVLLPWPFIMVGAVGT
ncbi:hypothetical protein FHX49_000233 [Microbacterium endophyticum]|uniref:DNA polymerase III subunit gamma/tau n=1 Tax=Microbacterium endophyticum TaxID=1526412 RepID=A0A7W4YM36_9MICO|nr:DNA polymerase III subunit gamma/tau [Microbacterium endophyticum]MBB2974692.1 hypothetical protein [Microbacterium endophyticum]NIK36989.1 hypothetical protein [Microbacterium endophyticum]